MKLWNTFALILLFACLSLSLESMATPREIQERLSQLSCAELLKGEPLPPAGPKPTVMSKWELTRRLLVGPFEAIKEYSEQRQAQTNWVARDWAFENQSAGLLASRERLTARWGQLVAGDLSSENIDPAYRPAVTELTRKVIELIRSMSVPQQESAINTFIGNESSAILEGSKVLKAAKLAATTKLAEKNARATKTPMGDSVQMLYDTHAKNIRGAKSTAEVAAELSGASQSIDAIMSQFEAQERLRRQKEMRFNAEDKSSVENIVSSLRKLAPEVDWSNANVHDLSERMRLDKATRKFMQNELQYVRRLNLLAAHQSIEARKSVRLALALRVTNDLQLARQISAEELRALRRSILLLDIPAERESTTRMNLFEREQIAHSAIQSEELKTTILSAALELTTKLALPTLPEEPSRIPPKAPVMPLKVRDESHARKLKSKFEDYQLEVSRFNMAWSTYRLLATKYQKDVTDYRLRAEQLRAAYKRKAEARVAYLAFLSYSQPQLFPGKKASQIARNNTQWAEDRLRAINPNAQSVIRQRMEEQGRRDSDDWFTYWILYYYILTPQSAFDSSYAQAALQQDQQYVLGAPPVASPEVFVDPEIQRQLGEFSSPPILPDFNGDGIPDANLPASMIPETQGVSPDGAINPDFLNIMTLDIPNLDVPVMDIPNLDTFEIPKFEMPEVQTPDVPDYSSQDTGPDTSSNYDSSPSDSSE